MALSKNKRGKVLSKKAGATGKCAYSFIQAWTLTVMTARKENKVPFAVKKTSSPKLLRVG